MVLSGSSSSPPSSSKQPRLLIASRKGPISPPKSFPSSHLFSLIFLIFGGWFYVGIPTTPTAKNACRPWWRPSTAGDWPYPVNEGPYRYTWPSGLSRDYLATLLWRDMRVGAGAANDYPMLLCGNFTFPPEVPTCDIDAPQRRGVSTTPLLGIDGMVLGKWLMLRVCAADGVFIKCGGCEIWVNSGAYFFFGFVAMFRGCWLGSISANDKMKICSNTISDVLFHAVSLVFA